MHGAKLVTSGIIHEFQQRKMGHSEFNFPVAHFPVFSSFRVFRVFRSLPLQIEHDRRNGGPALADPQAGAPDIVPPYTVLATSALIAGASAGAVDACIATNRQAQKAKSTAIANNTAAVV